MFQNETLMDRYNSKHKNAALYAADGSQPLLANHDNQHIFIITNTMHTIGVDKKTLFKTT